MPDFITHYYPAEDTPFRNLSDAPEHELPDILQRLAERRAAGSKRVFGRVYMDYRRQTEVKLKQLFEAAGGRPERKAPHYFVFGRSRWFEGLYPKVRSIELPLGALSSSTTSFTYPDSGVAMRLGSSFGLPPDPPRPYHEKVFRLEELERVIAAYGLPPDSATDEAYLDYHRKYFERYIEVQVWSDLPVKQWLRLE